MRNNSDMLNWQLLLKDRIQKTWDSCFHRLRDAARCGRLIRVEAVESCLVEGQRREKKSNDGHKSIPSTRSCSIVSQETTQTVLCASKGAALGLDSCVCTSEGTSASTVMTRLLSWPTPLGLFAYVTPSAPCVQISIMINKRTRRLLQHCQATVR